MHKNEKYGEYLLKDENGVPVESFKFNQITELNVDFRGNRYSLSGLVNEADYVEAGKKVRYELADGYLQERLDDGKRTST